MAKTPIDVSRDLIDGEYREILTLLQQGSDAGDLSNLLTRCECLPADTPGRESLLNCARVAIELGSTFRQYQQRERGLLAVSETAATLTHLRSLEDVLQGIVRRGRQLLGSHIAWLAGIDHEAETTFVIAIDGVQTDAIRVMRVPISTGIAGQVISSGLPFWTNDYRGDERLVHRPEIDGAMTGEGIHSAAGVPLFIDEKISGVLILGDRYNRTYQPWEIATLATLASHASAAMRNAIAFEATREALSVAEDANRKLIEQSEAIEFAANAHERLTLLVVKGGGIQQLADMVSDLLGSPVAVLDELGAVRCVARQTNVSNSIPGAGIIAAPEVLGAMGDSRFRGKSVEIELKDGPVRVCTAIGGEELMGAILIWPNQLMAEAQIRVFDRSALVLSLILLSQERQSASARDEVTHVVSSLLNPYIAKGRDILERASALGLDTTGPVVLAAIEVEGVRPEILRDRLVSTLQGMPVLVTELDGRLVVLISSDDLFACRKNLQTALEATPRLKFVGVVTAPLGPDEQLASVHERLKRCLSLLRGLGRSNSIVLEAEYAPYARIFDPQGVSSIGMFLDATIGCLLDHDTKRNTRTAETLLAYLDNGYGAKTTASSLGIHVNTLMNRLEVVDAILGDWKGQKRGAELHMALKLWKLRSPS